MSQVPSLRARFSPWRRSLPAVFGIALILAAVVRGQEPSWPQQLGPRRDGVSGENGLLETWPAGGPKVVWRAAAGVGMSGIAIADGRLVTMLQDAQSQLVVALDARTGKPLWQTAVAPRYENAMGNGPRATPTIAGDSVYVLSGEGVLAALDAKSGTIRWSHPVVQQQRGKPAEYGMASSPLVAGQLVIVIVGAPGATAVACDTASGAVVWKSGDDPAGYSSPVIRDVGGEQQLLAFTGNSLLGISWDKGTPLWRYPYPTDYNCNIALPISIAGQILISSGENHGSVLLQVTRTGGNYQVGERWSSQGPDSSLRCEWQTPVLWDGHLYGLDNVGSAGPVTHLNCVDPGQGRRVWQKARFGKGNLIAADGKLFISTMKGELVVVRATPAGYEEMGRASVLESTRQAPALAGGLLYLRDDREIVCLDVRRL